MRFAIRDDDTSYFTRPEELDRLWGSFMPHVPVSLAVVPRSLEPFHLGDPERFYQGNQARALTENPELVAWLRSNLAARRIGVMCHGYTHEYRRVNSLSLEQEYVWKPFERLRRETREGKRLLEDALGCGITTFVPPGNGISGAGLDAVRETFTNVLTTFPLRRPQDLKLNWTYLSAYLRRLYYHLRYSAANPFGEDLGGLRLIPSVSVSEGASWEEIHAKLLLCRHLQTNFIAAVHYWEVNQRIRDILWRLIEEADRLGFTFGTCPEMFETSGSARVGLRAPGHQTA